MTNTKESLGLHTISDGPVGGIYSRTGQSNLVLQASSVGTPHFTNWDAGLTSLENTTKERFEARTATRFLDDYLSEKGNYKIRFGAKDIKIADNLAAVSYPEYTDINKSIVKIFDTNLLTYHTGIKVNSYDYTCIDWSLVYNDSVLMPQINLDTLLNPYAGFPSSTNNRFDADLDGLYIIIEYTGYYTLADADPCVLAAPYYNSVLDGKRQILKYNSNENSLLAGEYTIVDFSAGSPTSKKMVLARIGHTLDIGPTEFFSANLATLDVGGFGFIGCNIYLLRYKPVIECGKVDLYTKKRGQITSYDSNGKLVCLKHNLQNGDIIKISGAKNSKINGIRYVQVVNDSTFIIYSTADLTVRVDSYYEGLPEWTACGNIYDSESQAWDYLGTLTSPDGRNGYCFEHQESISNVGFHSFYKTNTLGDNFNNVSTLDQLLELDFSMTSGILTNFYNFPIFSYGSPTRAPSVDAFLNSINFDQGLLKSTNVANEYAPSPLDSVWAGPYNYLNSFKFGHSIDLVKYQNKYVLAVGERGLSSIPNLNFSFQLPVSPIYGKVFLFNIYMDSNGQIENLSYPDRPVEFDSKYYAYTNDSSIAKPPYLTPGNNVSGFYRSLSHFTPIDFADKQYNYYYGTLTHTNGSVTGATDSEYFFDYCNDEMLGDSNLYRRIEYLNGMDYWYGSMVYSLLDLDKNGALPEDPVGLDYNAGGCRDAYFTNISIPKFLSNTSFVYSNPPIYHRGGFNVYPYVDNFGKAVALDVSGNDIYLLSSSKTKPIVERPNYSDGLPSEIEIGDGPGSCSNDNLNKTHCGYIHVFKNGIKIQKIYETEAYTLPSGRHYGFYYKADKFASSMYAKGGELVFGQTKPIDYHDSASNQLETSKIFIYKRSGDLYYKINTIQNSKNNNFSFINDFSFPDQKEFFLRDGNEFMVFSGGILSGTDISGLYYYPPDRFGNYFKYNGNILVANAFDIYNEDGEYHASNNDIFTGRSNEFNRPIDYLHVYEKNSNGWDFVTKIAPAFDEFDASYSYADILGPNIYHSIRTLGNRNYSNSSFNSRTWDIDLTGCYDLINDRILLKDPLSYSVFQKEPDYINSSRIETRLTLDKYFTYDEKYQAESSQLSTCQLKFDRVSAIHKYDNYLDDYKNLYCENNKSISVPSINYRAPIYFINIPINSEGITQFNSITLKLEEVRSVSAGVNLKLVLFKKDPRTTVYPFYNNLCSPNASDDAQKKWRSSVGYNQQTFLKGGVFDSSLYSSSSGGDTWTECQGTSCLAKLINASSILISGARRDYTFVIDNTQVDINDFIIQDDLILDSSDNRTITRSGVPTETIEFDDLSNIGYDVSVNVEASIIVGFIYQPMDYKINTDFSARADVRIIDITFDGYSSSPPSPISQVDYTYKCKFNKVVSFDYFRTYYNNPANKIIVSNSADTSTYVYDGKLSYTNPIMGIGVVPTASFNDSTNGTQDGVFSKSYEVLSIDNFGTTPETSIFTNTRSLDVQYLETLPLYINSVDSIPYINLFLKTAEPISSDINLFLQNQGKDNNFKLYIGPSAPASGSQDLRINGAYYASGDFSQHIVGGPIGAMPLFFKVPDLSDASLSSYIKGYDTASGSIPLYIGNIVQSVAPLYLKSRDVVASTGNFSQIIYGSTDGSSFSANNANLFIDVFDDARSSVENNIPLKITGPDSYSASGINTMPLYIGQIVRNASGDFSLYNFGGFGGIPSTGSLNFVINNTGINDSGSMPLSIPNRGFNDSLVLSENTSLFIKQASSSGNLDLYLNATQPTATGFNMSLKTGFGVLSSGTTTFIRGYRS
jgi:hypothetical protein